MSTIRLKNIKLYAFHGCLPEEEIIGSNYLVNLNVKGSLKKAAASDSLIDTIDYVRLQKIVKEQMSVRSRLLEHIAQRIIDAIFAEVPAAEKVKIIVSKLNPPIGGEVEEVSITIKSRRR